eukprot:TRINITY_DN75983_c0_g1_i1.p1 TRINITY_DN75983_c0_g1~~TRINITY_DN75983_c0_g1_i1.p1  ORF type:complete len:215 (+),score=3.49 TRINITY_DN75983_c0_g1_i1:25-669(+)
MTTITWIWAYWLASAYVDMARYLVVTLDSGLPSYVLSFFFCVKALAVCTVVALYSSRSTCAWMVAYLFLATVGLLYYLTTLVARALSDDPYFVEFISLVATRIFEGFLALADPPLQRCMGCVVEHKVEPEPCRDARENIMRTCKWDDVDVDDNSDAAVSTTCCICLDELERDQTVIQLKCHHFFHADCADAWLSRCSSRKHELFVCPLRCPGMS